MLFTVNLYYTTRGSQKFFLFLGAHSTVVVAVMGVGSRTGWFFMMTEKLDETYSIFAFFIALPAVEISY